MRHREMKASLEGSDRSARTDASGRFIVQNVPPGDYRITMRTSSTTPPKVLDLWAQTDVRVSGGDVDGVGLALAAASTISGRVSFERQDAAAGGSRRRCGSTSRQSRRWRWRCPAAAAAGSPRPPRSSRRHLPRRRVCRPIGTCWRVMARHAFGDGTTGWWITSIRLGDRELGDSQSASTQQ